ncbi:MAG TPA: glycosyltransferase, partial [Actinomycetales bacterium]
MKLGALARKLVPPAVRQAPGARQALDNAREALAVRTIAASRTFDRPWYEMQRGKTFSSDLAGIVDYVRHGRAQGLSPTPLFEPEWFDRKRWTGRSMDPFAVYLRRKPGVGRPHPLFDPMQQVRAHPEARWYPGGPLAHFLSTATDDTPLPMPRGTAFGVVTYGQLRSRAIAALHAWQQQEKLRKAPRRVDTMPVERQQALLDEVAAHRLPVADPQSPLVSIVMPTWNRAPALRRAIESVQAQTYGGWELIVVDDGSTDDTPYVLQGLQTFDPRIRVVKGEHAGVSRARNTAIAAATGRYVAFLDSDNTWEPEFLRVSLSAMEHRGLDAAYTAMELRDGGRTTYRSFDGGREHLLVGNHIDLNVLVVRAETLARVGGFAEDLRRTVDYDLVLRLSEVCSLVHLPYVGAIYSEDRDDTSRISVREPLTWDYVVRSRHLVDWDLARTRERVPGRVSAVVVVHNQPNDAVRAVEGLLQWDGDLEVVVVDSGSRRAGHTVLASLELADPRVRVHRTPVNVGFALGTNIGLGLTTGELLLVCDPHVLVRNGLDVLRAALDDDTVVVSPLLIGPQGTIESAGVTKVDGVDLPVPVLVGHPREDATLHGDLDVVAPDDRILLARAADVAAVGGLQPLLLNAGHAVDLTLRLREQRPGRARVVTSVRAWVIGRPPQASHPGDVRELRRAWRAASPVADTSAWDRSGLRLAHVGARPGGPDVLVPRPLAIRDVGSARERALAGEPLRWALQIAAPSGPRGEQWGDWHFAQSLAAALRRQGHEAVVDLREAVARDT